MKNNIFCPLPWSVFYLEGPGEKQRLCCASDIVSENKIKKIQTQFIKNKKPQECNSCWNKEDNNLQSFRQDILNNHNDNIDYDSVKKSMVNNIKIPYKAYELRTGSLCNIACRTCNPANSTGWYSDWEKLTNSNTFFNRIGRIENINKTNNNWEWFNEPSYWINTLLPNITKSIQYHGFCTIILQGGEPLIVKQLNEFYQFLIDNNLSQNIILRYTSNLTCIPNKLLTEYWKYFKQIEINGSIDGYRKVNDYIRYPAKFNIIEKNVEFLLNNGVKLSILTTVSTLNILYLSGLVEWLSRYNLEMTPFSVWNEQASIFSPLCISKDLIEKSYSKLLNSSVNVPDKLIDMFNNYLLNPKGHYHDLSVEFWDVTRRLDCIRNQNINDILPELVEILNEKL